MLATISVSGRMPTRSEPASPPSSRTLYLPLELSALPPPPKTLPTSRLWASNAPASVQEPKPTARASAKAMDGSTIRPRGDSADGLAIRQALTNSSAQPTPSASVATRSTCSVIGLKYNPSANERTVNSSSTNSSSRPIRPAQMRSANRPRRSLPPASWADPGTTRVMPSMVSPRRRAMAWLRVCASGTGEVTTAVTDPV